MSYKTNISNSGYSLLKCELSSIILKQIKKDLTVKPRTFNMGFKDTVEEFEVFIDRKNRIFIPKYYGIKKYGQAEINKIKKGKPTNLEFSVSMRPNQLPIVQAYMNNISQEEGKEGGGGIICAGCGVGKTVISLYISTLLKVKTLVIVNKEFLMSQWIERIQQFISDAKIGIIQGKKCNVEDKDIVIGMLQSVSQRDYEKSVFKDFGFVIYDECHHLGAKVFSQALKKTNFTYTLGLSATPERNDGLTKVFLWHLGDIVYREEKKKTDNVLVKFYNYHNEDSNYSKVVLNYKKQIQIPTILNNIAKCKSRNDFIISLLPELIEEGRYILILTERIAQVEYLNDTILEKNISSVGKYIGKMKQEDLDNSLTCRILVGTYNMIEEGFDCKTLDTLIMATPKVKIEQSVGRILRKQASERTHIPLIIDVCDMFANFERKGKQRITYYKKHKYTIQKYDVDDNNGVGKSVITEINEKSKKESKNEKILYNF